MKHQPLFTGALLHSFTDKTPGLAAGSYIIRINDNGNISTFKIIKK